MISLLVATKYMVIVIYWYFRDLSNNELSGSFPDFLSELSNLKYL